MRSRVSILVPLAVVAVAAVDFAWFRWFVSHRRSFFGFDPIGLDFGIVPMASALAVLGVHAAHRRGGVGPFAWGFALSGLSALAVYVLLCILAPDLLSRWSLRMYELSGGDRVEAVLEPILRRFLPWVRLTYSQIFWGTVVLCAPQFLFAVAGGAISKRSWSHFSRWRHPRPVGAGRRLMLEREEKTTDTQPLDRATLPLTDPPPQNERADGWPIPR